MSASTDDPPVPAEGADAPARASVRGRSSGRDRKIAGAPGRTAGPRTDRSEMMRRVRGKDTSPELHVRRALHRRGLRFRLQRRDLPGRPDIVLPALRVAVFVHGCFWHGHDCPRGRPPATNLGFWLPKLEANRRRDGAAVEALERMGWTVEIVWQCGLRGSTEELVGRLAGMRDALPRDGRTTAARKTPRVPRDARRGAAGKDPLG